MALAALKYLMPGKLTKELLMQSVPGALASGGLTGLMTGDIGAGATVGLTDLLGSAGISRALASRRLAQGLRSKGMGNIAKGVRGRWAKTETAPGVMGPSRYITSVPQNIGIMGTTFMTPMFVEPMFNKGNTQLAGQQGTTAQQLAQRQSINRSPMTGPLSDGTMFQLAGTPVPNEYRGLY